MCARSLKMRILSSFFIVIFVFSLLIALLGFFVVKKDILDRAQKKVNNDLNSARESYREQVENSKDTIRFTALRFFIKDALLHNDIEVLERELSNIRKTESLDILTLTDKTGRVVVRSRNPSVTGDDQSYDEFVGGVLSDQKIIGGTAIVSREELAKEGADLVRQAYMEFVPTPKAKPTAKTAYSSAMMIKAAAPVFDRDGDLAGVLYGGKLLNRNYEIVDKIKETLYQGVKYNGKDVGTATIFQDSLRISTNVMGEDGKRAIGTRVSAEVYTKIFEEGKRWHDRAFVVNDWYKTAYEPIRNTLGEIIGILYVGTLEQPFDDMAKNIMLLFLAIVAGGTILAVILSIILASAISRPLTNLLDGTIELSLGDMDYQVNTDTGVFELNKLAGSFNEMSAKLNKREQSLNVSNKKLAALNKRYIDLIGFVSHELKGILATVIMNACSVRDQYLGPINATQKKALDSVMRNLDYFTATVKKFLNLGKIENDELSLNKTELPIKTDVFDITINSLAAIASRENKKIINKIDPDIKVNADLDLLEIVANNLVGNAIKYGREGGEIVLSSKELDDRIEIEVYNDSTPISEDEKAKLFKRFSRLENKKTKTVKGTGLGLFITKEIIEKHGGKIWVVPRDNGNSFIFQIMSPL
jgi:two-component system, NtrC family, sensor kinase